MRIHVCLSAAVLVYLAHTAQACGLLPWLPAPPTLRQEFAKAQAVFLASAANPRSANPDNTQGRTDFIILKVLKDHPALRGKKLVTHDTYVAMNDPKDPPKFLIFAEVAKGSINLYRGVVPSDALLEYVKSAATFDPKEREQMLRFFFEHLEHKEQTIADDALQEFVVADYRDVKPIAPSLPAESLARWLQKPKLSEARVRLYSTLLGDCGKEADAALLIKKIEKGSIEELVGLLVGYFLLKPKEAANIMQEILENKYFEDKNKDEFLRKFAALKSIRFLKAFRQDRLDKKLWLELTQTMLRDPMMSDFALADFRRGKAWEMTDQVLDLHRNKGYEAPIIQREILKFAITSPRPRAQALAEQTRRADPDSFQDLKESLELEN